jgi:Methyltransferase domain
MLNSSRARILRQLDAEDLVLDVGGWAQPFERADWVIDLMPYETRGLYGHRARTGEERFSVDTWVCRDICDREPWPFEDGQFDFAICSHTLEDVRDPVWVCSELVRVARAGYLETPSRLEEQALGIQGPWVGWGHHHWLVEVSEGEIEFVFKHQILHGRPEFQIPLERWKRASPEERRETLWWEGSFQYRERIFMDPPALDSYLAEVGGRPMQRHLRRLGSRVGRLLRRSAALGAPVSRRRLDT